MRVGSTLSQLMMCHKAATKQGQRRLEMRVALSYRTRDCLLLLWRLHIQARLKARQKCGSC